MRAILRMVEAKALNGLLEFAMREKQNEKKRQRA
jgi:hypothetical protein